MTYYIIFNEGTRTIKNTLIEAQELQATLTHNHKDSAAKSAATIQSFRQDRLDKALLADVESDIEVSYAYTVRNTTTGEDIAEVFRGEMNGTQLLIKVAGGQITEKYFEKDPSTITDRDYVTYDTSGNLLEYYVQDGRVLNKYSASGELLTTTEFGPVPEHKKSKAIKGIPEGYLIAWSDKQYGFIVEYMKPPDEQSAEFADTYSAAYAADHNEALDRFPIVKVTINADGNETWYPHIPE